MLASKVSRIAQRVHPNLPATIVPGTCFAGTTTRGNHQRRRSSSKASCPPDSSNKPAPAAKVANVTTSLGEADSSQTTIRAKRTSKYRRPGQDKLLKTQEDEQASAYAALPAVPGVDHLDPKDLSFSSFFSLHRPLSLTKPFPSPVSEEAFASIFESRVEQDAWANGNSAERRPEDVIYALSQTIETIEHASAASQNDIVAIDVLSESASNEDGATHLDSLPRARMPTLEEIVAQARPFQAPPPPQPFISASKQEKKKPSRQSRQASPRTKSYTTTIVVTESRMPNGETTYEASASPIVRLADPADEAAKTTNNTWLPYRQRKNESLAPSTTARLPQHKIRNPRTQSRIRQPPSQKQSMLLISVKRQRKLKMKKHKYKKLMKRTRNLRRRLENK